MRRMYKLEGKLCGNCASKIQDKISRLDGVNKASVNFLTMKFTLDAADDSFASIFEQSKQIFDTIEPTCKVIA